MQTSRWFTSNTALFLGLWVILFIGGRSRFFQDPGTYWHVTTGNLIIKTGEFINKDPYTFTFPDTWWVPYQWLGEVVMSWVDRYTGFDGLLVGVVTLLAGLFTYLGARLKKAGFHWSMVAVFVTMALAASASHFHVRPHIITMIGFAILFTFLIEYDRQRITAQKLFWLIPIFIVWSNIHGGAMGGIGTTLLAIFGWMIEKPLAKYWGGEPAIQHYRDYAILSLIGGGVLITPYIGPYGSDLPATWKLIYGMKGLPQIIKEHSPLPLDEWSGWAIITFGVVYLMLLASTWPTRPRVTWMLALFWLIMAYQRVRHGPLFAIAALAVIPDLFPKTSFATALLKKGSDLYEPQKVSPPLSLDQQVKQWVIPTLLIAILLGLFAGGFISWASPPKTLWPEECLEELASRQYDNPKGTKIFCEYIYGGYLIYHTPGYKVFVDDRCEVFGDQFLLDYEKARLELLTGERDGIQYFAELEDTFGRFDYALVATDGGFDKALKNHQGKKWQEIKRTPTAVLYKRIDS